MFRANRRQNSVAVESTALTQRYKWAEVSLIYIELRADRK